MNSFGCTSTVTCKFRVSHTVETRSRKPNAALTIRSKRFEREGRKEILEACAMNTAESARNQLCKSIGVAEIGALFVGLLYVTGYHINSIFLRNYGIPESELFRLA